MPISNTFGYQTRRFNFSHTIRTNGREETVQIQRKQLWILPAFAITVNSSQGRSLDSAIIDLSSQKPGKNKNEPGSAEKSYVKLSRLRTGTYLGIQGWWPPAVWETKPDKTVLAFIKLVLEPVEKRTLRDVPTQEKLEVALARLNGLVKPTRVPRARR